MKILISTIIIIISILAWGYHEQTTDHWITEDMTNTIDVGGFR